MKTPITEYRFIIVETTRNTEKLNVTENNNKRTQSNLITTHYEFLKLGNLSREITAESATEKYSLGFSMQSGKKKKMQFQQEGIYVSSVDVWQKKPDYPFRPKKPDSLSALINKRLDDLISSLVDHKNEGAQFWIAGALIASLILAGIISGFFF